jgi:hypothetical protein
MDYTVLETFSQKPAFSTEQREHFYKKQDEIKDTLGEFCYLDPEFKRFPMFSKYFDYQMFLKYDLKNKATHPIHLYMQTLQIFYRNYEIRLHDLKSKLEFEEITEDEYNLKLDELNHQKLLADAEFNLDIKKKLKNKNIII